MRMAKTRTITMDDDHWKKGRIIAANENIENMSALFRHFIAEHWKTLYSEYKNFGDNGEKG